MCVPSVGTDSPPPAIWSLTVSRPVTTVLQDTLADVVKGTPPPLPLPLSLSAFPFLFSSSLVPLGPAE